MVRNTSITIHGPHPTQYPGKPQNQNNLDSMPGQPEQGNPEGNPEEPEVFQVL